MAARAPSTLLFLLFGFGSAYGALFSTLPRTLVVTASPRPGQVLKAGEETITVTWQLNQSVATGSDAMYRTVKVKLCYAPVSQLDRAWRKTKDDLSKDKTCQFEIVSRLYAPGGATENFRWTVERDLPSATYFVRAYAFDASDKQVAFGQSTDAKKSGNLFQIQAITGRHASIDIVAGVFSAFSVISLFGFFFAEKRKAKRAAGTQ